MRALSSFELLNAWEQGQEQPMVQRALLLLAAACPEAPVEELACLSIGQRDARLLTLRQHTFGQRLQGLIACPACSEHLELSFSVADMLVASPALLLAREGENGATGLVFSVDVDNYKVRFRLPNSLDVAAVAGDASATQLDVARTALLDRCLLSAEHCGSGDPANVAAAQIPERVLQAVLDHMAEADPQANVIMDLTCPGCQHHWQALFDITTFFWQEINVWACRLLRQVHTLASAYGWSEIDILAMSPRRRQMYLEMAGDERLSR